jgi:hypothetical protein
MYPIPNAVSSHMTDVQLCIHGALIRGVALPRAYQNRCRIAFDKTKTNEDETISSYPQKKQQKGWFCP